MGSAPAELATACTDAERRAANRLHDRLRAAGHEAWVETVWVRPRREWSLALHCGLAVVGGLVAIAAPVPGLIAAGLGAFGVVAEALGFPGPLRLAMRRRATQNVLVEPRHPDRVSLLLVARYDLAPAGRAARLLPTVRPWLAVCALAVTASAAARVAGAHGVALGAAQLVPPIALLLGATVARETALAGPGGGGDGVAVALELLSSPLPARFSAGLVLYGGGGPAALRTHLRREKLDPTKAIVLELGGQPAAWTARHPHLRRAAAASGLPEARRAPWAAPVPRLPRIAVGGGDAEAVANMLASLDAELAR